MKATVKKVMSDGEWNGKKKYKVEMSDGHTYSTFSDLNTKVGQEIEFEGTENEYGWRMKVAKQDNFQGKGGFRPQTDPKTMYMAYAKDLTCALVEAKLIKDCAEAQIWMCNTYDVIMKKVNE